MSVQVTLAILKPDVQRVVAYRQFVEQAMCRANLTVLTKDVFHISRPEAERFYAEHKGRFYFDRLVNHMICGPLGVYVLRGHNAISVWRGLLGPTKVYRWIMAHDHGTKFHVEVSLYEDVWYDFDVKDQLGWRDDQLIGTT